MDPNTVAGGLGSDAGAPQRVFLSHTSDLGSDADPSSFVAAAVRAVLRAGHAVADMAYFAARDTSPAEVGRVAQEHALRCAGVAVESARNGVRVHAPCPPQRQSLSDPAWPGGPQQEIRDLTIRSIRPWQSAPAPPLMSRSSRLVLQRWLAFGELEDGLGGTFRVVRDAHFRVHE